MLSFPLISLDNEVFPLKIFDEGVIIKENMIIEERGLYKYNVKKSLRKLLLEFEDIMPDKAGKTCAFWYRGLTIPDELEEKDPNCCINYKKQGKKDVFVCSTHSSRCIYFVKNGVEENANELSRVVRREEKEDRSSRWSSGSECSQQ